MINKLKKPCKVICAIGTRPEAIKMAPIILKLNALENVTCRVLATAQHREMLDQVLNIFDIVPDIDLNVMRPNQALTTLTARLLLDIEKVISKEQPDVVLAQGDTTTVMTIALACFYHSIPFCHVEAGLRTWDLKSPFPEEMNRVIAGRLARWHFAPTKLGKDNLLREGVAEKDIIVTGNTVIDSLFIAIEKTTSLEYGLDDDKRLILVTAHRRENFGKPLSDICQALLTIVKENNDIQILFPVHPNPNVKEIVTQSLGSCDRIILTEPLDYLPFVSAMLKSYLILTDSGGVQEEAPALGKPVLVLRNETERPEAVDAGVVKIVGPDYNKIVSETQRLLDDHEAYKKMAKNISPYGDGKASSRIVEILTDWLFQS